MSELNPICFVINDYDLETDTHYRYLYRLIECIASRRKCFLVVEKAGVGVGGQVLNCRTYWQRSLWPLGRVAEEFLLILRIRFAGCAHFYVHYSKYGGIIAGVISRLFGGTTYYWNCEEVRKHRLKPALSLNYVWQAIRGPVGIRLAIHLAQYLITGTPSMAKYYSNAYKKNLSRIHVLQNYIDLQVRDRAVQRSAIFYSLQIPTGRSVILFVHRLAERKGAHYLPEIIERVVCDNLNAPIFVVVGDGPYRETLEDQLKVRGMEEFVRIVGKVRNKDVGTYYEIADLFIMPSDAEGFPRVLLEAMAYGVPFISTDVGGVRDLTQGVQRNYLVRQGDIVTFSRLIVDLLNDRQRRQELAIVGKHVVESYSLENAVERFLEIVDKQ